MAGNKDFGDDLRAARRGAGYTQLTLAAELGVDPGAISGWERGIRMPDDQNRAAVAGFLGLSLADFLVRYTANGSTGQQSPLTSPGGEASTRTQDRIAAQAAGAERLSQEELRLLRRLLERLEGTG